MKKKYKRWLFAASLVLTTLFLSGCMRLDENNEPVGFFSELMYDYLVVPMEALLDWLGGFFGNYGLAIIAITVIIRIILLPITLNQQRSMMKSQIQMADIKPIIDEIQADLKETKDPARKQELNEELMQVYRDNDINVFGQMAGCLPLFIQMPIFIAIFHVFRYSEAIASTEFLGIQLGSPSILLALITGGLYFMESKMMQKRMPDQAPGGGGMTLMMPVMMVFIAITSPSGLTLYFLTSGILGILQSYYLNNFFKPKLEAQLKEKYGDKKVVGRRQRPKTQTSTSQAGSVSGQDKQEDKLAKQKQRNRNRNKGKQDHHRSQQ